MDGKCKVCVVLFHLFDMALVRDFNMRDFFKKKKKKISACGTDRLTDTSTQHAGASTLNPWLIGQSTFSFRELSCQ